MTPFAERAMHEPMDRERAGFIRELMSGAQFFECSALLPVVNARAAMPGDWHCIDEILACELPAPHTWIEFGSYAIAISNDLRGSGDGVAFVGAVMQFINHQPMRLIRFGLNETGSIFTKPFYRSTKDEDDHRFNVAELAINTAWYCIEAMQTPGGLCHSVHHNPTRQQRREAERRGKPCHKWVEIRLGRGAKHAGGAGAQTGRTVAWHYRRGHKINHPNPNFPKWRKGCWVGDTDAGIRTHNYIVEVPA